MQRSECKKIWPKHWHHPLQHPVLVDLLGTHLYNIYLQSYNIWVYDLVLSQFFRWQNSGTKKWSCLSQIIQLGFELKHSDSRVHTLTYLDIAMTDQPTWRTVKEFWESFPLGLWRERFLIKSHWLQRAQALVSVDLVTKALPKLTVNIRKWRSSGESFPHRLPPTHCPHKILDFLEFLFRIQIVQQSFCDAVIFTNGCNYLSL